MDGHTWTSPPATTATPVACTGTTKRDASVSHSLQRPRELYRDGALLDPGSLRAAPPLRLQLRKPDVCETQLHAGDRVVLYTDGIVEARPPSGEFSGEERLADSVHRASSAGDPASETVRRVMRHVLAHHADHLQDDASIIVLAVSLAGVGRRPRVYVDDPHVDLGGRQAGVALQVAADLLADLAGDLGDGRSVVDGDLDVDDGVRADHPDLGGGLPRRAGDLGSVQRSGVATPVPVRG
jgi:hypothetical protein